MLILWLSILVLAHGLSRASIHMRTELKEGGCFFIEAENKVREVSGLTLSVQFVR